MPFSAWALCLLYGCLLLWVWIALDVVGTSGGPNGDVFGVDFSHTYAAVKVLSTGHNPYDYVRLSRMQHRLLGADGLSVQPRSPAVLVGTSTFYLWLLRPIAVFPYQTVAAAWMLFNYALLGFAVLALLRFMGWRRRGLPALIILVSPVAALGVFYGNMITVTFAALAGALPLLRRHPFLAGMLLSVTILKLQVALPLAGLVILFHAPRKRWVVAGFLSAFLGRHLFAVVLLGPSYQAWWLESLLNFSRTVQLQPNLASLTGLYAHGASRGTRMAVELASVSLAAAATGVFWWRVRPRPTVPLTQTGWLWFLWIIATPYAHYVDEILLLIPVLALVGRDARAIARPPAVEVLYLLGLSILLFSWTPEHVQLLWAPLAGCAACFAVVAYRELHGQASEESERYRDLAPVPRVAQRRPEPGAVFEA